MNGANGKMEFFYQYDEGSPKVVVTLSPGVALPEILEAFESFLLASGFSFDGQLDIVEIVGDPNAEAN